MPPKISGTRVTKEDASNAGAGSMAGTKYEVGGKEMPKSQQRGLGHRATAKHTEMKGQK